MTTTTFVGALPRRDNRARGFFGRVIDAMVAARSREAERLIARQAALLATPAACGPDDRRAR
ncbi:hypothetical protein ACUN0C_10060 [Faunimonas sp. B44]|uniref:hypothetical protein n=1 Tax=Faunimonas sp. B44 TaxID=3461493 RepID=UPI0040445141